VCVGGLVCLYTAWQLVRETQQQQKQQQLRSPTV